MRPSIGIAISHALERTKRILFKPFDIGKWFVLGFCCFLAQCDQGGGNGGFNVPTNFGGPGPGGGRGSPTPQDIVNWISSNLGLVLGIALAVIAVMLAITAIVVWLASRGKFMFLDGVINNRAAVVEPWRAFRELGNSLAIFAFLLNVVGMFISIGIIALGIAIAWPDIMAQRFGENAILALIVGGSLLVLWIIIFSVVRLLLEDFVVPVMYLHNLNVMPAWSTARQELFAGNVGPLVLFYLMKILLSIAIGTIALLATCLTCCLTAVPYLGTVILLPLFVFMRCYSLCFIEQYGPQWRMFFDDATPPRCPSCGYDLRFNPGAPACPECGRPLPPPAPPLAPPGPPSTYPPTMPGA